MLCVVILSVVMLNVVMLSVVAPRVMILVMLCCATKSHLGSPQTHLWLLVSRVSESDLGHTSNDFSLIYSHLKV
jgi:hypothetical protein